MNKSILIIFTVLAINLASCSNETSRYSISDYGNNRKVLLDTKTGEVYVFMEGGGNMMVWAYNIPEKKPLGHYQISNK